jgi:GINS complex subunit 1
MNLLGCCQRRRRRFDILRLRHFGKRDKRVGHAVTSRQHPGPMTETRQFGELGTQLIMESKRSMTTDTLFKYNDSLVRSLIREQRDLEKAAEPLSHQDPIPPTLFIYQTAIARNKRCLLAYHANRIDRLRDMYWAVGGALPHILSNQDIRGKLSPHEVDYLRQYNSSVMEFRSEFSHELDITASITHPPKDLHVLVRVVRDCGVIQTESGIIDFKKGHRFMVRRADVEHLIVQHYLEEV